MPSASLILHDPNLLFVNAGMVRSFRTSSASRPRRINTATSVQKCVRTLDIENVGITTRHNTFFQMAGNFSFGDYFKRGAIELAWSLLTKSIDDGGYGFDPERLWVTVYLDDDEAIADLEGRSPDCRTSASSAAAWPTTTGRWAFPARAARARRSTTTAAPNTASRAARRPTRTATSRSGTSCSCRTSAALGHRQGRLRDPRHRCRSRTSTPAWASSASRSCCRVSTTSTRPTCVRPVITKAEELTGRVYGTNHADDVRFRVIADHARTAAMLIADGVNPGNDGRGYVLRRLLRRIVRSARLLGAEQPAMAEFMSVVRDEMAPSYPELATDFRRIQTVAVGEETAFLKTLASGSKLVREAADDGQSQGPAKCIAGRPGVRAARHLRLPDRPHARDGGRGRSDR